MTCLLQFARSLWHYLKEVSGENDYERYRARTLAKGARAMSAREFYDGRLHQKYSGINRCC